MGKLVLFMHVSLDGFTARSNGGMDWIRIDNDMMEYARARTEMSDTALYGRKTFELMNGYWPTAADQPNASKHDKEHGDWYNRVNKVIVSKTMSPQNDQHIKILASAIPAGIKALKQNTSREILMFGSPTLAGSLMQQKLIDEFWFFLNPIILGEGIPLFKENKTECDLQLKNHIVFNSGVICLHYSI
jgi:dihydrofolate reductase